MNRIFTQFQQFSNDFFFELQPQNLADCLQTFTTLTTCLPPLEFAPLLSKCANSLLISRHEIEPLTTSLLLGLCSEFPETAAFCAAVLPRCMGFLALDQKNDVCADLVEALGVFISAGNEKIIIPAIVSVVSAVRNLTDELQEGHVSGLKMLIRAARCEVADLEVQIGAQSMASAGVSVVLDLPAFKIMYKIDDICLIESIVKEILVGLRYQQFQNQEIFLINLKFLLKNPICQSLLRCPIYLSSLLSFLGKQLISKDAQIRGVVRAVFANLMLLEAFLGSDAVEECQQIIDALRVVKIDGNYVKRLQKLIQQRFDQYQANYNIPQRMCQAVKFI